MPRPEKKRPYEVIKFSAANESLPAQHTTEEGRSLDSSPQCPATSHSISLPPPDSSVDIARRGKKRPYEVIRFSAGDAIRSTRDKKAKPSEERRLEIRQVRKMRACMRCRYLKIRCSGSDYLCDACVAFAKKKLQTKDLLFTDCIRTCFRDVDIFASDPLAVRESSIRISYATAWGNCDVLRGFQDTPDQLGAAYFSVSLSLGTVKDLEHNFKVGPMLYLDILGSQLLGYLDDNLTLRGLPAAPRTVLVVQIGIVAWLFDTIKSRIRKGRHAEDASLWTRKLYQLHDMLAHFLKFLGMRIDMELYPYPGYNSIREFLGSEPQNRISKILYLLTVISN